MYLGPVLWLFKKLRWVEFAWLCLKMLRKDTTVAETSQESVLGHNWLLYHISWHSLRERCAVNWHHLYMFVLFFLNCFWTSFSLFWIFTWITWPYSCRGLRCNPMNLFCLLLYTVYNIHIKLQQQKFNSIHFNSRMCFDWIFKWSCI